MKQKVVNLDIKSYRIASLVGTHCLSAGPRFKKKSASNSLLFVRVLVSQFQKGPMQSNAGLISNLIEFSIFNVRITRAGELYECSRSRTAVHGLSA